VRNPEGGAESGVGTWLVNATLLVYVAKGAETPREASRVDARKEQDRGFEDGAKLMRG
jgi:hypothetical protein